MNTPLTIGVLLGSARVNRFNDKPAAWIAELVKKRDNVSVEMIDLKEWPFSFYSEATTPGAVTDGKYPTPLATEFARKIAACDSFIMVTPEYNRSTSALLKNALDHVYAEWNKKAVGFVAYGSIGGARAVEHLRSIAIELQLVPVRAAVHIMQPWTLVSDTGALKDRALDPYSKAADTMIDQVLWYARALKNARAEE